MSSMRTLADGSISWTQPASSGPGGWDGRCGETAAANLLTTYGKKPISPHMVIGTASDITPGTQPETFLDLVNNPRHAVPVKFQRQRPSQGAMHTLRRLSRLVGPKTPIAVLADWGFPEMHWITVVKIQPSEITYNDWGRQTKLPIHEFIERWSLRRYPLLGGGSWTHSYVSPTGRQGL